MRLKPLSTLIWFALLIHHSYSSYAYSQDVSVEQTNPQRLSPPKVWKFKSLQPPRAVTKIESGWLISAVNVVKQTLLSANFHRDMVATQKEWQKIQMPKAEEKMQSSGAREHRHDVSKDIFSSFRKQIESRLIADSPLSSFNEGLAFSFDMKEITQPLRSRSSQTELSAENQGSSSETNKIKRYGLILENIEPNRSGPHFAAISDSDLDLLPYAPNAEATWKIGALPTERRNIITYDSSLHYNSHFEVSSIWDAFRYPQAELSFFDPTFTGTIKNQSGFQIDRTANSQILSLQQKGELYTAEIHGNILDASIYKTVHRLKAPLYNRWFLVQEFDEKIDAERTGVMNQSNTKHPYKAGFYANFENNRWEFDFSQALLNTSIELRIFKNFRNISQSFESLPLFEQIEFSINTDL